MLVKMMKILNEFLEKVNNKLDEIDLTYKLEDKKKKEKKDLKDLEEAKKTLRKEFKRIK